MTSQSWHNEFDPQKFLSRIDVSKLIERTKAFNDSVIGDVEQACMFCSTYESEGIILNDKSFLCISCYNRVALISYPEKYEELRRQFILETEARRVAWEELKATYEYKSQPSSLVFFGWISILLVFLHPVFVIGSLIVLSVGYTKENTNTRKVNEWLSRKSSWEQRNPSPSQPELKHFHDPEASLSSWDELVLNIFNHWPGYPPFWQYLKSVVTARDSFRCQVTGCPSRLELHVHHIKPVSKGGIHSPENLVSLCVFHHALEPASGHERIWGSIKTNYFTLVCDHERSNRATSGMHVVNAHLRRLRLVTAEEIRRVAQMYGFACPECANPNLMFTVFEEKNKVEVACSSCAKSVTGPQELTEETGPRLAELLTVTYSKGRWKARWDMLSVRTSSTWGTWTGAHVIRKRGDHKQKLVENITIPICPKCSSPMRIIRPKPGSRWKAFWGCSQYSVSGCKGSLPYTENKHR